MAKKEILPEVRCMDCRHAYLMRSLPVNPIVARCDMRNVREVAAVHRQCPHYEPALSTPEIHPMIYLK